MRRGGAAGARAATAPPPAEWEVVKPPGFPFVTDQGGRELSGRGDGFLRLVKGAGSGFRLVTAKGCTPYPEAGPGATGRAFRGTNPDGTVFGFADTHLH